LHGPEAYQFTALTASAIAARVLNGEVRSGFQTPAGVYGTAMVFGMSGVRIEQG
jgi:short subunit dehydrogenase-like uncharacterized protein